MLNYQRVPGIGKFTIIYAMRLVFSAGKAIGPALTHRKSPNAQLYAMFGPASQSQFL